MFRVISSFKKLRQQMCNIAKTLPSIGWLALLYMFFSKYTVFGTVSFGKEFYDWFGMLQASAYTLFQVMTLESWSMGIARPVIAAHSWVGAYFISYVLISSYIIMNAVAGVLVGGMTSDSAEESEKNQEEMKEQLNKMNEKIDMLQRRLEER